MPDSECSRGHLLALDVESEKEIESTMARGEKEIEAHFPIDLMVYIFASQSLLFLLLGLVGCL